MALPQRLEPDGQGLAIEGLGRGVLPLRVQVGREVVVDAGGEGMALPQPLPENLQEGALDPTFRTSRSDFLRISQGRLGQLS